MGAGFEMRQRGCKPTMSNFREQRLFLMPLSTSHSYFKLSLYILLNISIFDDVTKADEVS
jgi:hypothetical protein